MLELSGVTLSFGGVYAINGLDLTVKDGEITALIGPNGAGKTSALNVVSRFYQPQEGSVTYRGTDLLSLPPHRLVGLGVARSFQNVALFANLTVLENLMIGADHVRPAGLFANSFRLPRHRRHERLAKERARDALEFMRIDALRDRLAGELSFGDQKLVDMARALTAAPTLVLLDEPAAGLADGQREWLSTAIAEVPRAYDASVVLIDHDMELVLGVSSHVVVMDFGRKIAEGTPQEVRENPRVLAAYLGEE
ncbi:MAG TPA: ABC transporter ATP-binding protein [Acidimicrobiales bacterium]|nr:ABC transporter ATP-binding protein [Acidimicrobiales bacterium]